MNGIGPPAGPGDKAVPRSHDLDRCHCVCSLVPHKMDSYVTYITESMFQHVALSSPATDNSSCLPAISCSFLLTHKQPSLSVSSKMTFSQLPWDHGLRDTPKTSLLAQPLRGWLFWSLGPLGLHLTVTTRATLTQEKQLCTHGTAGVLGTFQEQETPRKGKHTMMVRHITGSPTSLTEKTFGS